MRLFVSTSDRSGVDGKKMEYVWETYLKKHLPVNVTLELGGNPVRKAYEFLGEANESCSSDTYYIYSDPADLASRFPEKNLVKYLNTLYEGAQVVFVPIKREGRLNISGAKMRTFIIEGDKESFISHLPDGVDGDSIWSTLAD